MSTFEPKVDCYKCHVVFPEHQAHYDFQSPEFTVCDECFKKNPPKSEYYCGGCGDRKKIYQIYYWNMTPYCVHCYTARRDRSYCF